mgnify:CR=1 FL=1
MDNENFFIKYFSLIILCIVIIIALVVVSSIFNLSFTRQEKHKLTKKVTFAPGI